MKFLFLWLPHFYFVPYWCQEFKFSLYIAEHERPPDEIPVSATPKQSEEAEQDETMEAKTEIQLEAIKSEGGIWAEEIELNWSQVAVRDELLTLRNFLKQGMDFSVVEEMVNCFWLIWSFKHFKTNIFDLIHSNTIVVKLSGAMINIEIYVWF